MKITGVIYTIRWGGPLLAALSIFVSPLFLPPCKKFTAHENDQKFHNVSNTVDPELFF